MLSPNEFLALFEGSHTYCAIDDKKLVFTPVHHHEGYNLIRDEIFVKLTELNKQNFGIFFCVNEIDRRQESGKHRTSKMIKRIRAIWADDDEVRSGVRTDFPLKPNVIIQSSPGKFHYYWLTTTNNIEEWGYVMNGIANTYGTDNYAKDLVRVLRVPGFMHCKGEPVLVDGWIRTNELYSWEEITKHFPPDSTVKKASTRHSTGTHHNVKFDTFMDARNAILTGAHFHGSILWLLNHWVNKGIKDANELAILISDVMQQSTVQDDRWEARTNEQYMANNIRDALAFVEANPLVETMLIPEVQSKEHKLDNGYPPGLMGKLCQEIFETAPHPNEEIALVAAFALVAGVVGRSYNVLNTGLNLYIAMLADSGAGKAVIKNSINQILLRDCAIAGGSSFRGATRFTGPKALFIMLQEGLSRVSVLEESGLMSESTAGDQKGLTRVMLDIYTSSGRGEYAGGETYSKVDDSVPILTSPALTIAHVSTPLSYLRALKSKDATVSGDIARIWMIRTLRDKKYLNIDRRKNVSESIVLRMQALVKHAIPHQASSHSAPIMLGTDLINIQADADNWVDLENKYKAEDDQLRRTLTSRAFVKTVKIASVASVFNGLTEIGREEYKWAHEAVSSEITSIEDAVATGSSDDMLGIVKTIVLPVISKIVNDKFKDVKKTPPKPLKGKGIFTSSNISQALRNNEPLKRMSDDPERPNPRTGIEKVMNYMVRSGLLTIMSEEQLLPLGSKAKRAYRVTDDLVLLMSDLT